jgi:hypothetical protein
VRGDLPEDATIVVDVVDGELTVEPRPSDDRKAAA